MRNLGRLITVKPGEPLLRKIPFTEGTDGRSITGQVIAHKPAQDHDLVVGKNTQHNAQGDNLLIPTISGIPKQIACRIKIDDVLVINNVDVGYGHVTYQGSVIIEGDVYNEMKVSAGGNILIAEFVDSTQLECRGDLIVGKGIIGHKVDIDTALLQDKKQINNTIKFEEDKLHRLLVAKRKLNILLTSENK